MLTAVPRAGHADLQQLGGNLSIGAGKLLLDGAPGGSLSFSAGFDYPVARDWRVGAGLGFHLLGTRNEVRGSFSAAVDYSEFETTLFAHWLPRHLGPVRRISLGPALTSARAALSAGAGGASFLDLAVEEIAPGLAAGVTIMPGGDAPVKAGLEIGLRRAYLRHDIWQVALARLAVHF
jgi:hypothetical protein